MIKKINEFIKENRFLLIGCTLAILFCFGLFALKIRPFVLAQDQAVQYELFYEEWIRMVRQFFSTKELPFYSWNSFLGTDFFTTKSYYLTGDFFLPLYLISPFSMRITLMLTTIILIYVSACSMSIYLKKFGIKKETTRQYVAFAYAFSGLAMMYFSNFMFFRFYALLPLLFYGVEKYIQDKKLSFFALMVALLFLQSYYFMFPTSLFLILYFFISKMLKGKETLTAILKSSLPLIASYFVGFLISAVLLVPTILMIINHPRVGGSGAGLIWEFKVILGFLYSHITAPFNLYSEIPYIFVSGYNGHAYWYSIYASLFIWIAALQQFLFDPNKRRRNILLGGYGLLLLFAWILPLNSIMHGFSEPSFRWMFLIIFYLCLSAAIALDKNLYQAKKLSQSFGLYSLILVGGTLLGIGMKIIIFPDHLIHVSVTAMSLLIGWIYVLLVQKGKKRWVYVLSVIEITAFVFAFCLILSNPAYQYNQTVTKEYIQYYQSIDEDPIYRMYLSHEYLLPSTVLNLNQSLSLDYKSISMYDTTYEPNLSEFLQAAGFNTHIVDIKDEDLMKMLGVKYVVVYDETELSNPDDFEYVYNLDHLKVYQWKNYNSLGFTYSQIQSAEESPKWLTTLIVPEKWENLNLVESPRQQLNVTEKGMNSLRGTITTEKESVLFLSIPYNKGWKIFDHGEEVEYEKVQLGFIGILLDEGEHYIEMFYTPQGFKLGAILTLMGLGLWGVLVGLDRKIK